MKTAPEAIKTVVELRQQGKTREEIMAITGFSLGRVKNILTISETVLPMEQRQANAYRSKLEKNPNAMSDMRKTLVGEVIVRRSNSIRQTYKDPELCRLKGKQVESWWASIESGTVD